MKYEYQLYDLLTGEGYRNKSLEHLNELGAQGWAVSRILDKLKDRHRLLLCRTTLTERKPAKKQPATLTGAFDPDTFIYNK